MPLKICVVPIMIEFTLRRMLLRRRYAINVMMMMLPDVDADAAAMPMPRRRYDKIYHELLPLICLC